jgi:hypothetical protein
MTPHTFTIEGAEYIVTPHDGIEGLPVVLEIAALGAEPLVNLIKSAIQANSSAKGLDPADLINSLDMEALAESVQGSLQRLAERPQMVQNLFIRTIRNGEQLANPTAFRQAYQGRWKEFGLALIEIVKLNGFIPF